MARARSGKRFILCKIQKMKEILQAVEHRSINKAKKEIEGALSSIHWCNRQQLYCVYILVELCNEVGFME
ncbi:hypothetical protein PAECIP111802_03634 [Paenibacillus allorhizosphaerae]|uniref:Uncharacterized protein n=1 Tax=Paenibacillus allorhizosphaerae TaxID=2849866 RepID=A0ABM8VK69_9BACL|nr:hypothetical protein PAECIP111802_03634 [Paenibacillus allorhizosphaerae]